MVHGSTLLQISQVAPVVEETTESGNTVYYQGFPRPGEIPDKTANMWKITKVVTTEVNGVTTYETMCPYIDNAPNDGYCYVWNNRADYTYNTKPL